jgi:hypothetical protein
MQLSLETMDDRIDAAIEAAIERVAAVAIAEIRALAIHARRGVGQSTRRARERIARTHERT